MEAKRVFQDVEAIPAMISASGKNVPNTRGSVPSAPQTSLERW